MRARADAVWLRAKTLNGRGVTRHVMTGLVLLFSVVFLGRILFDYWPTLMAYNWEFSLWPLLIGCAIYALHLVLAVRGWSLIMQQLAVPISLREHFRIYCFTRIAGRIPGLPWHLVARAVLYQRLGVSAKVTGVATGLEMILVILSGLLSGLLIWFILPQSIQSQSVWWVLLLVLSIGLIHPAVIQRVLKLLGPSEVAFRLRYRDMLLLLGLFVLVWALGGGVLYTVILVIYPLPLSELPSVIGAWGLSGATSLLFFFSPTTLGIKEMALSLLLGLFVPAGLAVVVAILTRLFLTAAELAWAIVASQL